MACTMVLLSHDKIPASLWNGLCMIFDDTKLWLGWMNGFIWWLLGSVWIFTVYLYFMTVILVHIIVFF